MDVKTSAWRRWLPATLAALFGGVAASAALAADEPKVLNIYNWSDYIAPDTLANFEKETGIKVHYDNYDNNEILHAKLVAGQDGLRHRGAQRPLRQAADRRRPVPEARPQPAEQLGQSGPGPAQADGGVDPGNQYLVDWLWGYVTVGINVDKVKKALGDLPMPENAWSLIFDPSTPPSSRAAA
jgi:putrescine transport system substrate-binding protein